MLSATDYFEVAAICGELLLSTKIFRIFGRQGNLNKVFNDQAYNKITFIQGVTGGTDQTSGECSLGHTIPI